MQMLLRWLQSLAVLLMWTACVAVSYVQQQLLSNCFTW
jgi:hypothetical protein